MHLTPAGINSKLLLFATPWWPKWYSACGSWVRACACVMGGTSRTLSSSACGEVATPEALPVQAAETGHCWKAPCWQLPEASVVSGTKDRSENTELKHWSFRKEPSFSLSHITYKKYSEVSFSTVLVRLYLTEDVIHKLQEDLIDIEIILSTRFAEAHSTYSRGKLQQK